LYKHALESIFSHLNLPELARISATCRDWSAAVDSMRPIGARAGMGRRLDLHSMRTSRLTRHVVEIHLLDTSDSSCDLSNLCAVINKQRSSVATVSLRWNSINSAGLFAIAAAIKHSKSLLTLDLGSNRIGNYGAIAIAKGIRQSKSLTAVDLSFNSIGDEGAKAIAEAVTQSKSLATVNLRGNAIRNVGAFAIVESIKQSTSLTAVNLSFNFICTAGLSAIAGVAPVLLLNSTAKMDFYQR